MALVAGTKYYARCRHKGTNSGLSDWGEVKSFTPKTPLLSIEVAKLVDSTGASNNYGGYSAAISGDGLTIALGNKAGQGIYASSGNVTIYVKVNGIWTFKCRIYRDEASSGQEFGHRVTLSYDGSILAASSLKDTDKGDQAGSVSIFKRNADGSNWIKQIKITGTDEAPTDSFGYSLDVSRDGNTLAIGSINHDISGNTNCGAVYIYIWNGTAWVFQSKLSNLSPVSVNMGASVSLSSDGNTLAIGATGTLYSGSASGVVYIFTRSGTTWSKQATLNPVTSYAAENFGSSVALSANGNSLLVAATGDKSVANPNNGAIHYFTRTGTAWTRINGFVPPNSKASSFAGIGLDMNAAGDIAIVGSAMDTTSLTNAGLVSIYQLISGTWTFQHRILASDTAASGYFGAAISICDTGDVAIIGSYGINSNKGAGYILS